MKVKDIIEYTQWIPNPRTSTGTPRFSIMMPTYRRFASGHLTRAIQSVLNQTFKDFELFLIDDGSTDGSFDEIQRFMKLDSRIHCLHHPRNVGLPAIGCYEAFKRAQAEYLMFCFDDTEYRPDAIEQTAKYILEHNPKIAFGYIDILYPEASGNTAHGMLGKDNTSQAQLKFGNFLPNLGAVFHRSIPYEIGFLDPHLAIARLTDWDYWKRAAEVYKLHRTEIHVGTEFGLITGNSLGSTYPLDQALAHEWTTRDRNKVLTPGLYEEYNIQEIPTDLSNQGKLALQELADYYKDKFWSLPLGSLVLGSKTSADFIDTNTHILVLTYEIDATISLFFDYVFNARNSLRYVSPYHLNFQDLLHVNAVIVSGQLFTPEMQEALELVHKLGIPLYYHLDNTQELSMYNQTITKSYVKQLSQKLSRFQGVLIADSKMYDLFVSVENKLQAYSFPLASPAFSWQDHSVTSKKPAQTLRIGLINFPLHSSEFTSVILPALTKLASEYPVELVVCENDMLKSAGDLPFKVYQYSFDTSYTLTLGQMQSANIDVLIQGQHPVFFSKIEFLLLNAWITRAVPIFTKERPQDQDNASDIGLFCTTTQSWYSNLKQIITNPKLSSRLRKNLQQYVSLHFSGQLNEHVLRTISSLCPPPGPAEINKRFNLYLNAFINNPAVKQSSLLQQAQSAVELTSTLEYQVFPVQSWKGFKFIIGTHQKKASGNLSVEIVDSITSKILRQQTLRLENINDNQIVIIEFDVLESAHNVPYLIRFKLASLKPTVTISIYEANPKESKLKRTLRRLRLLTQGNVLACQFLFAN